HWVRLAASRTFCTAGKSSAMRTVMMAITTSSSIRVNARRLPPGVSFMVPRSSKRSRYRATPGSSQELPAGAVPSFPRGRFMIVDKAGVGELLVCQQLDVARQREDVTVAVGPVLLVGQNGRFRSHVEGPPEQDHVPLTVPGGTQDPIGIAFVAQFFEKALE